MPLTSSAKKAMRQALRKQAINYRVRAKVKKAVDAVRKDKNGDLSDAYSTLDRAAKLGVIPKNKASRLKSRLTTLVKGRGEKMPVNKKAATPAKKVAAKKPSAKKAQ